MSKRFSAYRIFLFTVITSAIIITVKYLFHYFHFEVIVLGSLHSSAISGVIFVIGFLLSSTISDYKEAERIPAEIASAIEDMNEDAAAIHQNYPKFDLTKYQAQLLHITKAFTGDLRNSKSNKARAQLYKLGELHAAMEKSGVPANFVVKLKQQQAALARHLFRVNYIQRITFIPSATILAWSIVVLTVTLLLFTEVEPFFGGLVLTGVITFILVYVLQLIRVIRTPFHDEGKTRDDVSLFLLERTIDHLRTKK
jgi:hypothetical protein